MKLRIKKNGRLGNNMLQYMTAATLKEKRVVSDIFNISVQEWNIATPSIEDAPNVEISGRFSIEEFLSQASHAEISEVSSLGLKFSDFLPVDFYRKIFDGSKIRATGFPEDRLVINIRLGDIANGLHKDYTLLPISFYRTIIETSGLTPVFLGELGSDEYTAALKQTFPSAEFVPSRGAMVDFETLRRSANICCSVSTFSWLAAWLSEANRVFLPLSGGYNPRQRPDFDMIPINDDRYTFFVFPINYAGTMQEILPRLEHLTSGWSYFSRSMMRQYLDRSIEFKIDIEAHREIFDINFYQTRYPDVARAVKSGRIADAFFHYKNFGIKERRMPFDFNQTEYLSRYQDAAREVGLGRFPSALEHYLQVGRAIGYSSKFVNAR